MLLERVDLAYLTYLLNSPNRNKNDTVKFTDFIKRCEFKEGFCLPIEVVKARLKKLMVYGFISYDVDNLSRGTTTATGLDALHDSVVMNEILESGFNSKWFRGRWSKYITWPNSAYIHRQTSNSKQKFEFLEDEGYVVRDIKQPHSSTISYLTTERGDIFVFSNIKAPLGLSTKWLWSIYSKRGSFDFTKYKGQSYEDICT